MIRRKLVQQYLTRKICSLLEISVTRVLKYQIFSRVSWFLLSETINLLSISHIPMTHLTHFRIFLEQAQVYIYIENLTRKRTKSGTFFSKIRTLVLMFKKGQGTPPPLPLPPYLRTSYNMETRYALLEINYVLFYQLFALKKSNSAQFKLKFSMRWKLLPSPHYVQGMQRKA